MHSTTSTSTTASASAAHPLRAALANIAKSRTPSPTPTTTSSFDVSLMPRIHPRTLHSYSVHFSNGRWVATLVKVVDEHTCTTHEKQRVLQTTFSTEAQAKKFAKAFSPPKLMTPTATCMVCSCRFNHRIRPHSCRNCGICICEKCSTRWGVKQIPKTYLSHNNALTVRVCKHCDWLSNAFCMALLQGKYQDALVLYDTQNVNLRSSFGLIKHEAMFPVHCAVLGGNVTTLQWLVDKHACPISMNRTSTGRLQSVQTSAGRSLIDLAMTGKPKLEVLRYLVMEKNLSVMDTKDPSLAPRTLEALLRAGVSRESAEASIAPQGRVVHVITSDDQASSIDGTTTLDDACILCYERSMDCVLIPCGHQVCCRECGKNLNTCPVCKVDCSVLRIFRY
mmetsp:Transcript_1133/g.2114  ORF Transcript_1133/g.2114 Transcript_1133/m.2114 type:complete len:393 (+) Transcript_1133:1-1179(+)